MLRRDDGHVLRKALEFKVKGKRKQGQLKKTWKTQVAKESKSVGLEKKDAMNGARWGVGVRKIADKVRKIRPPPFTGINQDQNWIDDDDKGEATLTKLLYTNHVCCP